ncbi:response regulator [Paenibacillus tarimensis]
MYKVMIADDEILDLEGMRRFIPWNELGLTVVAAVNNAFSAFEVLKEQEIDILVTDVNMPQMSGLELVQKAQEIGKRPKVVFVSGHQDFHYVKRAMSLNAHTYVLKPMDDSELIGELAKLKNELDEEKERQEAELAYMNIIPAAKNQFLLQLLEGLGSESVDEVIQKQYGFNQLCWPVRVGVMELEEVARAAVEYGNSRNTSPMSGYAERIIQLCGQHSIRHVCRLAGGRIVVLAEEGLTKVDLQVIVDKMMSLVPLIVTIGLGAPVDHLFSLEQSYRQAISVLDDKPLPGKGCVIEPGDVQFNERLGRNYRLIHEMIRYIQENLHRNVTLREVADHLLFSPNYLGTLFKEETGQNFSEFLIMQRMRRAGELLRDPKLKVYEVADRVGYRYMPYFTRQFKETFGMTPGAYRRNG